MIRINLYSYARRKRTSPSRPRGETRPASIENAAPSVVSFRAVDSFPAIAEEGRFDAPSLPNRTRRASFLLFGFAGLLAAGLLLYSQTMSFVWDEGFHLVAAQLINAGKIPYRDFCFPQTPLNTYWNAGWMLIFGETWRVTHVFAALLVAATVFLMAQFVLSRFPVPRWRLACALTVASFIGMNTMAVQFGTVAQAYGMGLFLTTAAFRVSVQTVGRKSVLLTVLAGFLAGAAADSTLLTAPAFPVLLLWILLYDRAGNRRAKCAAFITGGLISFVPVFCLFASAPRQTIFNIVEYQALYRRADWPGATPHDVDVLSKWLVSTPALFMGLLALAGIIFIVKKSDWDREHRAEFYLCGWLTVALAAYIATAHPTFERYFVFMVPFISVVAAAGLYSVGSRLGSPQKPFWPAFIVIVLVTLAIARALFDDRNSMTWNDYDEIAQKVERVTPRNGTLFADEVVYFLLHRIPPSGMEFSYSHKLQLPPAQEALYHVISYPELKKQMEAGKFDTAQSCNDDRISDLDLEKIFPHKTDVGDCTVFWGPVHAPAKK